MQTLAVERVKLYNARFAEKICWPGKARSTAMFGRSARNAALHLCSKTGGRMNIIANKNRQWAMKVFEKTAWKCHMCKKKNRIPYFMPFDYFCVCLETLWAYVHVYREHNELFEVEHKADAFLQCCLLIPAFILGLFNIFLILLQIAASICSFPFYLVWIWIWE